MCAFTVETDRARFARERGGAETASFRLVSARLCKGKEQGKREMGGADCGQAREPYVPSTFSDVEHRPLP